jgi:hypothetical protein
MIASLSGPDFVDIHNLTPDKQAVGTGTATFWTWGLTAKQAGTFTLGLTVDAMIHVPGYGTQPQALKLLRARYTVRAVQVPWTSRVSSFFDKNWQWLWGAIFVPLGLWIYRRWRPARSATPTSGSDNPASGT